MGSFSTISATLYENLNFNFIRDIAPVAGLMRNPVAGLMRNPLVMVVHQSIEAKTVRELISYSKANPGKLNIGTGGIGSPQHMAGELFKMMARVDMVHVHYRGSSPMLTDLLRGEIHVSFDQLLSSIEHVRAGNLRALAVTTATASQALPGVPTVSEFVPGYETSGWTGLGVLRNTPEPIVRTLQREISSGLADAAVGARLEELGGTPMVGSPSDFSRFVAEETQKWAKVIRAANIKVE